MVELTNEQVERMRKEIEYLDHKDEYDCIIQTGLIAGKVDKKEFWEIMSRIHSSSLNVDGTVNARLKVENLKKYIAERWKV